MEVREARLADKEFLYIKGIWPTQRREHMFA